MKKFRVGVFALASFALLGPAWSEVRTLFPTHQLTPPPNQTFTHFGQGVAINGADIIVLAAYEGGQSALLYQRGSNGAWTYRRALQSVSGPSVRSMVRMRNGIAAVQFGDQITIFERVGSDYVPSPSAAPIRHPGGIAISANRVLVGGDDCDYDAVVYQKGTDGIWRITGRLDDNQGACQPQGLAVELYYDYALLRVPDTNDISAWRRNGTALNWVPAGSLDLPPGSATTDRPLAMQGDTAVTSTNVVFRRSGTTWTREGMVVPADYANGAGTGFDVKYRDGVLLTSESWFNNNNARPYAYVETSPGQFEHVAILGTLEITQELDISGRTVVVATRTYGGTYRVGVFHLPAQLRAPSPIVNNFEQRDLSGFTFSGGQFALATRGTDDVLARTNTTGLGIALVNDSDWSDYQRVEADIAPSFSATDGWVGLVTRYVDANNYYFAAIRNDGTFGIYRRLNGVNTLLREGTSAGPNPSRVSFTVDGDELAVQINTQFFSSTTDRSLRRGRAGLATFQARADFDDVHVAAAARLNLMSKDSETNGLDFGRPLTERGGDWQLLYDEAGVATELSQRDRSGRALAYIGVPVENQDIVALARVDSLGSSEQGAWLGLLARYVDERNYYYLALRNNNQLQIRKYVNGVLTILATANFTVPVGQYRGYRFLVVGDQLQAFVGSTLVASAQDADIPRGGFGVGTYRAAATWLRILVSQP